MNGKLLVGAMLVASRLDGQSLSGYSISSSTHEASVESDAVSRPSANDAEAHSRFLSLQTHMAGTPAQARTRDYVISQMKSWGLETEVRSYTVWMPHPITTRVWRISPDPMELNLVEGPIAGGNTSGEDHRVF